MFCHLFTWLYKVVTGENYICKENFHKNWEIVRMDIMTSTQK